MLRLFFLGTSNLTKGVVKDRQEGEVGSGKVRVVVGDLCRRILQSVVIHAPESVVVCFGPTLINEAFQRSANTKLLGAPAPAPRWLVTWHP